uniref:WAP domain-containing protein n=1 Tax=Parascaris equorum TaxID=6256 RepID=A0A914R493_PAREQ
MKRPHPVVANETDRLEPPAKKKRQEKQCRLYRECGRIMNVECSVEDCECRCVGVCCVLRPVDCKTHGGTSRTARLGCAVLCEWGDLLIRILIERSSMIRVRFSRPMNCFEYGYSVKCIACFVALILWSPQESTCRISVKP